MDKNPKQPIDALVKDAVFAADSQLQDEQRHKIRQLAAERGIFPASIQGLYQAAAKGLYHNISVPAINLRGLTYHMARAIFRAAMKGRVGAFIFEIARSEMGYTKQRPAEYAACVLAAAIREGFQGPIFLQGDHFKVDPSKYSSQPAEELKDIEGLVRESLEAGFLNIDIDASALVDLTKPSLKEQQAANSLVTAGMTRFIRRLEPKGVTVSIGGEVGEVGKRDSTIADLRAFMAGYLRLLGPNIRGISKVAVQTGTVHGGIVLPDGSVAGARVNFKTLKELSRVARQEYTLGGAVQHGASTLPEKTFNLLARAGALEVHLATGFQNLIYDSPYFPRELLDEIYRHLLDKYSSGRKEGQTEQQFLYKTRKKAFGDFKQQMWGLPEENLGKIREALENQFASL
ncbi:MAG: class II fructose-bisphosphate aldolase, partial [Dehalococcoidales bacterium]